MRSTKDSQAMISYKLFLYFVALEAIIREIERLLDMMTFLFGIKNVICFQNKDTITLRQAFLSIYILCKSDEASCNILGYRK